MFTKKQKLLSFAVCLLILTIAVLIPTERAGSQPPQAAALQDFDFSSSEAGWILLGGRLYRTTDAGQNWTDITPPASSEAKIGTVFFIEENGWALLIRPSDPGAAYSLAITTDGGRRWTSHSLDLFAPEETHILPGAAHLFFLDAQTGWLVIRQASSVNFSIGFLFRTTDGGSTWERLSIPIGESVYFETAQIGWTMGGVNGSEFYRSSDGGQTWQPVSPNAPDLPPALRPSGVIPPTGGTLTRLDRISEQVAWAKVKAENCSSTENKQRIECVSSTGLQRTLDGGQTWQVVPLPFSSVGLLEVQTTAISETKPVSAVSAAGVETLVGQGFDMCEMTNLSKMQMWWNASPYLAVNLYIGGSSRGCSNSRLSASFLAQLEQQGWKFIPTWVGPQAPCTAYTSRISSDPAVAYTQGIGEANAALVTAANLGLAKPDLSGTVIYYDMEAYNFNNLDCKNAVNEFLRGWVDEMEAKGNVAGVYGSSCGTALTSVANILNPPEAIWIANWIFSSYNASATVWDAACLSNAYWPNHQRIRQYAGDHYDTWGNLTMRVDSNVLDGMIAKRTDFLPNDDMDAAIAIPSTPYADNRSIVSATTAADDPVLPCLEGQGSQSVWYKFTPAQTGSALVSTRGSAYDTVLAVWEGTRGSLLSRGCNDDAGGAQSEVQFDAQKGVTYYIEAAARSPVTNGALFLSVFLPANDDINGAVAISSKPSTYSMVTTSAGDSNDDPPVPACNLAPGPNSVWYTFTPTESGPVSMDTLTSDYDTYLAVWSGSRGNLNLVACNDDVGGQQSRLEANLTAGVPYFIEVGQYNGLLSLAAASKLTAQVEALSGGSLALHLTTFYDVPGSQWAWNWVERLVVAGITKGCSASPKNYCPESPVTRAQMAVFLLRVIHGAAYSPPAPSEAVFADVPADYWASAWISQLFGEGITVGCGEGNYCPENNVTRAQMAVFLLRARHGSDYTPPPASGTRFGDVPASYWAAAWIEQLAAEGITSGCDSQNYCPDADVKRDEMAVFLVRTFGLP